MDYFQILVVHSRGVYNFRGMILVAQVSFIFSILRILFKNLFQILAIFKPYCVGERDLHTDSTKCKWVCEMNRGIHCKSGTSFMGQAVNAGIGISNEERQFLIPDANSCINCLPHKGCPWFAMNASIHLTHSFAFSAICMEISFTTV